MQAVGCGNRRPSVVRVSAAVPGPIVALSLVIRKAPPPGVLQSLVADERSPETT
jgi:hypothetical protein